MNIYKVVNKQVCKIDVSFLWIEKAKLQITFPYWKYTGCLQHSLKKNSGRFQDKILRFHDKTNFVTEQNEKNTQE